ncbi:MAG: AbrB/MazE/SpoVT family DNA-binding domain-containing protein [Bacillota bacterium]|nr:AbrB/MazE/SpoVT family DNA-binding domain-containing protein [Bacillota bacterium]
MRKSTGLVRRIDDLGRVVIPMEIRKSFGIEDKDPMEIFTDENGEITLRKYEPGCSFCGNTEHLLQHKGKMVCVDCVNILAPFATTAK